MAIDTPARIAVLGAGPIGLETALYARYLGYDVDIYERGRVAKNVLRWGHVRMFSPFGQNRSALAMAALRAQDAAWQPPADDALLTGREFAERLLVPLSRSDLLADNLHEQCEVVLIGRDGLLKGELAGDEERGERDFHLLLRSTADGEHGRERLAVADAVVDTTGTFGNHNYLGNGGVPALGELAAEAHIEYGLPDVLGAEREHYGGRNILLVGAGDSAATNLVALAELAGQARDTWITWVVRSETDEKDPRPIEPIAGGALAERERLARLANRLAADDANHVTLYGGTTVESVAWHAGSGRFAVRLRGRHAGELEFDRVVANVGYRGDARLYGELQIAECPTTGAAIGTGLILGESDYYVLGAKSRGRDSRFVIRDGLDQIRQLFAILGDRAELDLYATMAGLC
jgi:hypothetical protein